MTTPDQPAQFKPPTVDPWKGFRGVCSGTLILEAIVVFLGIPAVAKLGTGIDTWEILYLTALGVVMILACGVQSKPWGMGLNLALQVGMIAAWVIHPAIGALGLLFAAVWAYLLYLRKDIEARIERGLLRGQRD